jgi:hypothetical protein
MEITTLGFGVLNREVAKVSAMKTDLHGWYLEQCRDKYNVKTSLVAAKIQIGCIGSIEMEKGLMHYWFA